MAVRHMGCVTIHVAMMVGMRAVALGGVHGTLVGKLGSVVIRRLRISRSTCCSLSW